MPRRWVNTVSIALLVVGIFFVLMAVVYVSVHASSLPSWWPGHEHAIHAKAGRLITQGPLKRRGVALGVLGAGSLFIAWWLSFRYEPSD